MSTAVKTIHAHIVKTPDVRGGKARIDGTRVCVVDLVSLLRRDFIPEQMRTHYSDRALTLAEVHSALAYYYDNSEEIEAEFAREDEAEANFEKRKAEVLAELARRQPR
jgi:uncharacterized protein (DUF433 family)